ncbi:mCG1027156, partial [Mus musculus]
YPDITKFLLPFVVAKGKISAAPSCLLRSTSSLSAAPSLLLRCISSAPFLLLKGTSPFTCAFKPPAWLIHLGL